MLVLFTTAFFQNSNAQQDSATIKPEPLLSAYYNLKDALVSSNAIVAATNAATLAKVIKEAGNETVNENTSALLLNDVTAISQSKDIKLQREKFATLSANMVELAKKVKLSAQPVYEQYCPMKKASWLSNDKAIKNPYYGNAMLTCGSVKATL